MTAAASPPSIQRSIGERELIVMMATLMALQALSIDSMLPALPNIAGDLGAGDANRRQLVIGVYLIGTALGALVPGALADRFGRRPVVFGSIAAYCLLSLVCALAPDFSVMLAARSLQGFLSAGLTVLPSAIVRDRYSGDRMARMQSTIALVFMAVPMMAPSFGQAVLLVAGWRWIFGTTAAMSLLVMAWAWLRLPETLDPADVQPIRLSPIITNMGASLLDRSAIGYVIGAGVLWSGLFGYLNSSQQLIAEQFGGGDKFPLIFAGMAGGMALANLTNSRIVERFGARRVSQVALFAYIAVAVLQVWRAFGGNEGLWDFVALMGAQMCLIAFMGANFSSVALQPFGRTAGAAASAQMFVRSSLSSLLGIAIGMSYDGSARNLSVALLTGGLLTLGLVLYSERGKLFRRLYAPGAERPA
ncbi:DHA1 family bicyclomycin/chloramphenicol resistance-like MFS transporter [Novosphingobium kunmingense]|uniref:DHA1 family bicyclomycin/chloramphenicol resistance-like MFS transporter n=1 Tax=Novosphingobium kunmingense TaxID=1211806 RepID=A0A2N0H762_9SPHN|nr:multidrug effflux MFS transporter [Novosphingobium kunmingense]PKB14772.1 DHA1 family bicyclomycin/chloramphenicol resistance-like MFS transporter [Novosphingobium kunmingense]